MSGDTVSATAFGSNCKGSSDAVVTFCFPDRRRWPGLAGDSHGRRPVRLHAVIASHAGRWAVDDRGGRRTRIGSFPGLLARLLGPVHGPIALAIMASQVDSALSWQIFGVVSLAAAAALSAQIGGEIPDTLAVIQARKAPRTPLVWSVVIAYGAMGVGYIIPATYLPVMAREVVQSPLIFGWSWPVFGAAAFASTLLVARIQRHFSNRQVWAASQIVMAAGLLLPVIHPHISTIIIAGICVGGTFMIITMTGMKEAHRIAPAHDVMRHIAVMTAAFASGQMIGPVFASSIYHLTRSFSVSLVLTSMILVITALILMGGSSGKQRVKLRS